MSARTYLTPAQAVEYLQLKNIGALYHAIREHGLPYGRVGRLYRFDPTRLDAWVNRHERQPFADRRSA